MVSTLEFARPSRVSGAQRNRKPCRVRALEQKSLQPLALTGREFKRSTAGRDRFQCLPTANLQIMLPTAHAARIHIEAARDLGQNKLQGNRINVFVAEAGSFRPLNWPATAVPPGGRG